MTYKQRIHLALEAYYTWATLESMNNKDCTAYLIRLNRAMINRHNTEVKVIFDQFSRLTLADKNKISVQQWTKLHRYKLCK